MTYGGVAGVIAGGEGISVPLVAFVKGYILWDGNRAAPPGFGVRVRAKNRCPSSQGQRAIVPVLGTAANVDDVMQASALVHLEPFSGKVPTIQTRDLRISLNRKKQPVMATAKKPTAAKKAAPVAKKTVAASKKSAPVKKLASSSAPMKPIKTAFNKTTL